MKAGKTEDECRCTVDNCDNGDVACDSYNNIDRDVDLLVDLKVQSYRFSLSWPRLLPDGTPQSANQEAIQYYSELLDKLKETGSLQHC